MKRDVHIICIQPRLSFRQMDLLPSAMSFHLFLAHVHLLGLTKVVKALPSQTHEQTDRQTHT